MQYNKIHIVMDQLIYLGYPKSQKIYILRSKLRVILVRISCNIPLSKTSYQLHVQLKYLIHILTLSYPKRTCLMDRLIFTGVKEQRSNQTHPYTPLPYINTFYSLIKPQKQSVCTNTTNRLTHTHTHTHTHT